MINMQNFWLLIGFLGQGLFALRLIVQWLASERKRQTVIPRSYWYVSLFGAIALLAYAIKQHDPVFIIGQSVGLIIYLRNLKLSKLST